MRRLGEILEEYPSVLVAFSGGVDSSVVAAAAHDVKGANAVAVTLKGPSLPTRDLKSARAVARLIGIRYLEVEIDQLSSREYTANPSNRCYFCRKVEGGQLRALATRLGIPTIVDGVHLDDLSTDRPGLQAMQEWDIRHPLVEAGLGKREVRAIAAAFGLPNHDAPSNSCLASRVAHGEPISAALLTQIDRAEEFVGSLGFARVRVRVRGRHANVEVGVEEETRLVVPATWERVRSHLEGLGFVEVAPGLCASRTELKVIP